MADKQVTELELQNVDTGELEDLLEDVKMINMDAYTDESVQNLQKAVENAVNGEAENKELGNLYMEVVYAIRNLEKKS